MWKSIRALPARPPTLSLPKLLREMTQETPSLLRRAKRVVIKVGSSLVTNEGRGLDEQAIGEWCRQIAHLMQDGREVIMVSSGAIAEGMKRLGWTTRPKAIQELQAAAAVGQMGLAQMYETKLRLNALGSAQVLLTHADLADRERYLNARSTLLTLLKLGVVPVINENDTVVNDEIKFGDNDTLGALVANLVEADALIILTDQKGLYTADPRKDPQAQFVTEAHAGSDKPVIFVNNLAAPGDDQRRSGARKTGRHAQADDGQQYKSHILQFHWFSSRACGCASPGGARVSSAIPPEIVYASNIAYAVTVEVSCSIRFVFNQATVHVQRLQRRAVVLCDVKAPPDVSLRLVP